MTMTIIDDLDLPSFPTSQVEVIDFAIPEDQFHMFMTALYTPTEGGMTSASFPRCLIDGSEQEIIRVTGRTWPIYELECVLCGMEVTVE